MYDAGINSEKSNCLTPRTLLAVALVYLAATYLCSGAMMLLAFITGPFASPAVGIIVLIIARRIYRGESLLQ